MGSGSGVLGAAPWRVVGRGIVWGHCFGGGGFGGGGGCRL